MKILIAKDEAFNFTYQANIESFEAMGEIIYFSPLHDSVLPECDLLYLPGGYPELFIEELSQNTSMLGAIRDYANQGGQIFAECGGFMYLCSDIDSKPMCGVLPLSATMEGARLHLGYRQMEIDGVKMRGHEFHYSTIKDVSLPSEVKTISGQQTASGKSVSTPIYKYKNVIAGYTHWYWAELGFETIWNLLKNA